VSGNRASLAARAPRLGPAAPAISANGSGAVRVQALPYNPTWQAKFEAAQKKLNAIAGEEPTSDKHADAMYLGPARIFDGPYTFEMTVLPEQTFFNYDVNEYRHVWTDGPRASTACHAYRHGPFHRSWEGETLVVHTSGLKLGVWANSNGRRF